MADGRLNVIHQGEVGTVDESELDIVLAQGGTLLETEEELNDAIARQEARESPILAGTAAAARGATLGASDVLLTKTGAADAETLRLLSEENPTAEVLGQTAGIAASVAATGGVGGIAQGGVRGAAGIGARAVVRGATAPARAAIAGGKAVEGAVRTALAGRAPASVARLAAKGAGLAAEGAAFGVGGAITEATLDPEFTADAALTHVGLGAILGGGLGIAGTIGSEVLGRAVPAAVQAGVKAAQQLVPVKPAKAVKGARKRVGKAAREQAAASTDAAELKALTEARKAATAAGRKAAAVARPHAQAVAQTAKEVRKQVRTLSNTVPVPRARPPKTNAVAVATEAQGLSRAIRTEAAAAGDTVAQRAVGAYDRTIASMPDTNVGGRFQAAAKLRNTLSNSPATKHLAAQVDNHLSDKSLFGKAATEWAAARDATEALGRADEALAGTVGGAGQVSEMLAGVNSGKARLDTLRGLSTQFDQYLAIVRGGKPNAPNVRIPTELRTANLAAATNRFKKAITQAEAAVKTANVEKEASETILNMKIAAAAGLAKKLLPNNKLAREAMAMLSGGAKGGIPGALAGMAFGVDPLIGASVGNLAHMARNPKQFMAMLNRLHQAAGSVKTTHRKALTAWMKEGKDSGKTLRRTANLAPGLRKMVASTSPDEKRQGFKQYRQALVEAQANPEVTAGKVQSAVSTIQPAAPQLAERLATASLARLAWLIDAMPAVPTAGDLQQLLDESDNISDSQLQRFARVAAVVEDPSSIIPRITSGMVTREEVVALRETAPGYHRFLLETIADEIKSGKVPYSRRVTLGVVFEAPFTSGLANVQTYQQLHQQAAQEQSQPKQLVTRSPTPSSQSQLSPLDAAVSR